MTNSEEPFYLGSDDEFDNSERAAYGTEDSPLPVGWYRRVGDKLVAVAPPPAKKPKRYLVEFVSMVTEKYTAEVEVPDHIVDGDLRDWLQDVVDCQKTELIGMQLDCQDVQASYLTHHEEVTE